jgi:hypothetical protein
MVEEGVPALRPPQGEQLRVTLQHLVVAPRQLLGPGQVFGLTLPQAVQGQQQRSASAPAKKKRRLQADAQGWVTPGLSQRRRSRDADGWAA